METKKLQLTPLSKKVNMEAALNYVNEYNECRYNGALFFDNAVTGVFQDVSKLKIPNETDPWNIIECLIEQHYAREKEMMMAMSDARMAIKKVDNLEAENKVMSNIIYNDDRLNSSKLPEKVEDRRIDIIEEFDSVFRIGKVIEDFDMMQDLLLGMDASEDLLRAIYLTRHVGKLLSDLNTAK